MPEQDLAALTHRLAALTRRAIGERMASESWAHQAGFRPGCIGVLRVVAAREPVSQREVSEALLLDPSDLVTLVDILEGAGLVERRRDPADRRRYALEVTPRGQLAVVRLREINREVNEELLAPLDEQEQAQLAELIGRVVRHHTGEPEPAAAEPAGGARRSEPAGRTVATAGSEADEDGVREVPVMPGHPERARKPYDPNREAERARARAAESLRP
jgi:MarR family transcriptional regulator, lower aerobic nicotinate degradation pathway regulator